MSKRREWTQDERAAVVAKYGRVPFKELVAEIGREPGAIRTMARNLGVMRAQRYMAKQPKRDTARIVYDAPWLEARHDVKHADRHQAIYDREWRQSCEAANRNYMAAVMTLLARRETMREAAE